MEGQKSKPIDFWESQKATLNKSRLKLSLKITSTNALKKWKYQSYQYLRPQSSTLKSYIKKIIL